MAEQKVQLLNEKILAIQALEEIEGKISAFEKSIKTPSLTVRKERDELTNRWAEESSDF